MKENLIYALRDPRTDVILYVGQTRVGVSRARNHWRPSALEKRENPALANKLRKILSLGLNPGIEILERCDSVSDLDEAEIYWIAKCRYMGYQITNILDGGNKPPLIEITEEYRAKLRAAHTRRAGQPGPNTGKRHSEESKARISASQMGRPAVIHSQETYLKIAKKRSSPFSDESGNLYDSPMDASLKLNLNRDSISVALNKGRRLHGHKFTFVETAVRP